MARFIDPDIDAAGQRDRDGDAVTVIFRLAFHLNTAGAQGGACRFGVGRIDQHVLMNAIESGDATPEHMVRQLGYGSLGKAVDASSGARCIGA